MEVEIKRVVGAQFIAQVLSEAGGYPLDWPEVARRIEARLQETAADEFEQGYWVDTNQIVPAGAVHPDLEILGQGLPEEIRSGLNWSGDKHFFFMLSVLRPTQPLPSEAETSLEESERTEEEAKLEEFISALPEMRDKEAAALIEARNSVVAAWLWRRYAADTPLAANSILIAPCCPIVPVEG